MNTKDTIKELYETAECDYEFYFRNGFNENEALKMGYFESMEMPELENLYNEISEKHNSELYSQISLYIATAIEIVDKAHAKSKRIKIVIE